MTWKRLDAFQNSPELFAEKLKAERVSFLRWLIAAGTNEPLPKNPSFLDWQRRVSERENLSRRRLSDLKRHLPLLERFSERGLIAPFQSQLACVLDSSGLALSELELALESQTEYFDQISRRAVILELNIAAITNQLQGESKEKRFSFFLEKFEEKNCRWDFFKKYPVLTRIFTQRLDDWLLATEEFYSRLKSDRGLLLNAFNIELTDKLRSLRCGGDRHNNGRVVTIVEFVSGKSIVYKPRSVSLEAGFQKYLHFFNSFQSNRSLKEIHVVDREEYGWVEFVHHQEASSDEAAFEFHWKLGVILGLIYSLDGVDVFFENLVASDSDPVVIDLESMFHTFIDDQDGVLPSELKMSHLRKSVAGIGILPTPSAGHSEKDVFDISVLGAAEQLKAPYKVPGITNFGKDDMRMTSIPGWFQETHATPRSNADKKLLSNHFLDGLEASLCFIMNRKAEISAPGGVLDTCFAEARRRLIVRDTTVYGTLLQDETHPHLIKNQIDREMFHDNLWRDLLSRTALKHFIESELAQLEKGDIPYFSGKVNEQCVVGSDGTHIDLSTITSTSPLEKAREGIKTLTELKVKEQLRLAASTLGVKRSADINLPNMVNPSSSKALLADIVRYLNARATHNPACMWLDTTINPVPLARDKQPVSIQPMNPFLYEGVSGVAMFLFQAGQQLQDEETLLISEMLFKNCFVEIEEPGNASVSGFTGLASLLYAINRCKAQQLNFGPEDGCLERLVASIEQKVAHERAIDVLTGLGGTALALLPYVKRTSSQAGIRVLKYCSVRLLECAREILKENTEMAGLTYFRGFSHGINGLALALYRLANFFDSKEMKPLAKQLLLTEFKLVCADGWTDEHKLKGSHLSAWCHGSAGIALGLYSMGDIVGESKELTQYLDESIEETLKSDTNESQCICHGSVGNAAIMHEVASVRFQKSSPNFHKDLCENLVNKGFDSLDIAQTLSSSLMTGITGVGFFMLENTDELNQMDFITLT